MKNLLARLAFALLPLMTPVAHAQQQAVLAKMDGTLKQPATFFTANNLLVAPGSTSITTLGTVTIGIWNAVPITSAYIDSSLTGKTYNGITPTALATGFSIAGGTTSKTLTVGNTLTLAGTDSTTMTFPGTSATIARTDAANTFSGNQTFNGLAAVRSVTLGSLQVGAQAGMIANPGSVVALANTVDISWRNANDTDTISGATTETDDSIVFGSTNGPAKRMSFLIPGLTNRTHAQLTDAAYFQFNRYTQPAGTAATFRIETEAHDHLFEAEPHQLNGVGGIGLGANINGNTFLMVDPPAITVPINTVFYRSWFCDSAALTVPTGTTSSIITTVTIYEPNITLEGSGAVTTAANLYIGAAPTEGGNNYSLWSVGAARFDATLLVSGVLSAGSGPTALTDASGKILAASLNTVTEAVGGTNQTTYAVGDTLYASATNTLHKLTGNTTTAKQYLSQTGNGSASAAPVWATVAQADLSDYHTSTWTPTGNGITLTVNYANYTAIGRLVVVQFDVTWPVTADAGQAKIGGLPYAPMANWLAGGVLGYCEAATAGRLYIDTTSIYVITSANSTLTNAACSGSRITGTLTYFK